jgi:eukaryotic-like serine/threonine-protein kinase
MKNLTKILLSSYVAIMMIAVACKKDELTPTPPVTTPTTTPPIVKSTAKDISKFSFAALSPVVDATIDASTKAITTTVPTGTDVTKLVPTITISDKASVSPASGVAQDFSKEVNYTVTAEDGGTVVYKVKIDIDVPDALNDIFLTVSGDKLLALDAETGIKKWEFVGKSITPSPAVVNGIVYFGSRVGFDDIIFGLDVKTGVQKWQFNNSSDFGSYSNPPTIVDGVIYLAKISNSPKSTIMYAVDITKGTLLWKFPIPASGTSDVTINASATVANGLVYFSSYNNILYALDAKTGTSKWTYTDKTYSYSNPAIVNGILYFSASSLIAFDALTGTKKWELSGVSTRGITIDNGILYGATVKNNDATTHAISSYDAASGTVKWEYKLASQASALSTVSKGLIYFTGDTGDKVVALDIKTGTKKWDAVSSAYATEGPAVANGSVYVASDKKIYAFDAKTGVSKWEIATTNRSGCTIIDKNGKVYYSSTSGMQQ